MKHLIPVWMLLLTLPGSAAAQIDLDLSEGIPRLRAHVAGVVVSAGIGARGKIDWRIADPRDLNRSTGATIPAGRRTTTRNATAASVLATADNYVGTKYVWGGETPSGFDCSGFVQYVFRQHGIELPRTSRQQAQVGQSVATSQGALEVGDLMLFATNGTRIDHIAIYAGNGEIIHSSSSGGGVGYDSFDSERGRWFLDHHVATRRVIDSGFSLVGPLTNALRAVVEFDPPDRAPRR